MKNMLIAQSGGPTAVINASLSGAIKAAVKSDKIGKIYGALHGIQGIMAGHLIDIMQQIHSEEDFYLLERTPSMALGSCRYKIPDTDKNNKHYDAILKVLKDYDIGYFFYIGGNDSMDTVRKLSKYFKEIGEDIKVMGIPKTIDNDLPCTDHSPGFASAAKYVATSVAEVARDALSYNIDAVTIIEVMGRHAGWLTCAAAVPKACGYDAPHLIYLPEVDFNLEQFISDIKRLQQKNGNVVVAISEGIHFADGTFVSEAVNNGSVDAFGHKQLSGAAKYLEAEIKDKIGCKIRSIELSTMQRAAGHLLSKVDLEEAIATGAAAVEAALNGETGKMVCVIRDSSYPYQTHFTLTNIDNIANIERKVPLEWINAEKNGLTDDVYDYLLPLLEGEVDYPVEHGIPKHFTFQPVIAPKLNYIG